ncbi:oligomeric golgi complex component, COG2-domain-containing protein [Cladochytrium replicatum]|nr:oligomeric golgi complex component, COG2-domain-containing protein [Cladochytrium replicatum]
MTNPSRESTAVADTGAISTLSPSFFGEYLSFDRSVFLQHGFDPVEFLGERTHIALDRLKAELSFVLKELKNELVELINQDYADFINLSTNLVGVDKMIEDLKRPLDKVRSDVLTVKSNLTSVIDSLESKLEKRASIREKKGVLQLFISIHESVGKIEELLEISSSRRRNGFDPVTNSEMEDESLNDGKLIERVAIEYNQLQYLVSKGKDLPFVTNIEWRINRIRDTLTTSLSRSLKSAIQTAMETPGAAATASLTQFLRTYVLIDRIAEAEEAMRYTIIRPFIKKNITKQSLMENGASSGQEDTLQNLYNRIMDFVSRSCALVLDVATKAFRSTHHDVMVDLFWADVVSAIVRTIPTIFSPGIPDVFHRNYTLSMEFVSQFEVLCQSEKSVKQLRSHQTYIDFMKRWQLSTYFQLRFNEVVRKFEEGVAASTNTDNPESSGTDLIFPASRSLISCVEFCWDRKVYTVVLTHRFWQLTLQLLGRYALWLKSALPETSNPTDPNPLSPPTAATPPGVVAAHAIGRSSSPGIPQRPGSTPPTTLSSSHLALDVASGSSEADEALLRQYLYLFNDVTVVREKILMIYESNIIPLFPRSLDSYDAFRESILTSLDAIEETLPDLSGRVVAVLVKRCSEPLRYVKEIPRQYRQTNKEAPTRASYFIPTMFEPLTAFIRSACGGEPGTDVQPILSSESSAIRTWRAEVATQVCELYGAVVSELLANERKMQESLRKFKKGKKTTGDDGVGGLSDEDKIRLQVYLDVEQLTVELSQLGFEVDSFRPLSNLKEIVESARTLVGSV